MLIVNTLIGFGSARSRHKLEFMAVKEDNVNRSAYTFSSVRLGSPTPTRRILVVSVYRATATISSMTIAGVSASAAIDFNEGGVNRIYYHIANVPTGTSGDIVLTMSASADRMAIFVYRLDDLSSYTPSDTGTSTTDSLNTVTVPSGGVAVFASFNQGPGTTCTWTNATKDSNTSGSYEAGGAVARIDPGDGSTPTVSVVWTSPNSELVAGASWS